MYTARLSFLTILFLIMTVVPPAFAQSGQETIRSIDIEGVQRVEEETVRSYLNIQPGDTMSEDNLDKALKSLFRTGLFADVMIERVDRGDLVVRVKENPIVNRIAFEGNEKIKDQELLAEISLSPRQVFTDTKARNDVTRLYQIYRRNGRFAADIEPKIIELDQNRVDLIFEINEGPLTKIQSIRFVGNRAFSDSTLRGEVSSRETAWYRFLSESDRFDPDRLEFDQELLRRFYLQEGYADFRVVSSNAELSKDKQHFFITMTVEEGDRYKIGEIDIDSRIRDFDASILRPSITFESGDWYDVEDVSQSIDEITKTLGDNQYAFVQVSPKIDKNPAEDIIDVTFIINESPRVFVERIDIRGNLRTEDRVIRREIELVEGDPFVRSKVEKSEQAVNDLNFFETVEFEPKPGSAPDQSVLDVKVTEKSTGEISLGGGFSTADGPLLDLRLSERNFLGKGQRLLFASTLAGERSEFNISFTEPYFMRRDLIAGADIFHITRDFQDESSFDQKRTGGGVRIGYPLTPNLRQTLRYRLENNDLSNVSDTASIFIREQEGQRLTSAISQRLQYQNLDSMRFPTEGTRAWLDTEVAGLGGDAKYVSGRTGISHYIPISEGWIFNAFGEVGAIEPYGGEEIQINERFFLGGNSLRGFEQAGVGPRDLSTNDALGGRRFYRATLELTYPIVFVPEELGIKGHAFTDAGSLFDIEDESGANIVDETSIRAAAGVGLSWDSPFGPIRFDLAYPIADEDFDETEVFRFNFGTRL